MAESEHSSHVGEEERNEESGAYGPSGDGDAATSPAAGLITLGSKTALLSRPMPCPYLGSSEGREHPFDTPSRRNSCYAQKGKKKGGRRPGAASYSRIPREKQESHCLSHFAQCELYQKKLQEEPEDAAGGAGSRSNSDSPASDAKSKQRDKTHRSGTRKRKESRKRSFPMFAGRRWRKFFQVGLLTSFCFVSALALYIIIALEPSSWLMFVFETRIRQRLQSLGLRQPGIAGKTQPGGIPGGGLRSLKGMSAAQKKKLKSKGIPKGMSRAQLEKLKKQFKGRR